MTRKRSLVQTQYRPPEHHRSNDVLKNKLLVTVWADIVKDTTRVREFVDSGNVHVGHAVVIDEGGYLARRDLAVYADRQRGSGQPNHNHPIDALIFRYPGERVSRLRWARSRRRPRGHPGPAPRGLP